MKEEETIVVVILSLSFMRRFYKIKVEIFPKLTVFRHT